MLLRIKLNRCTIWVDVLYYIISGDKENNVSDDIEIKNITINNIAFDSGTFIPRAWFESEWGKWLVRELEPIIMNWDNQFIQLLLSK